MCGVVGYVSSSPKQWHLDILIRVFQASAIRGLHAFGVSYFRQGKLHTLKSHELKDVVSMLGSQAFLSDPPTALIGHNRYSTSGDWKEHSNNQPIVSDGHALVFNGVVSQGERSEWERRYGKRYITDNDGEIVLREAIDSPETWLDWFAKERFSFAGGLMEPSGRTTFVRNARRPLWAAQTSDAAFIASTRDILKRSEAPGVYVELVPNKRHEFGASA